MAARERGAKALADAEVFLRQAVTRDPDFAPASATLAYVYALTPLFAPSLRGGMPEEERKIVERTIPRSDALARRATERDPKGADGFVGLGYANMVQRKMLAAEDAFKQALALNPNQADGLHGYSQLLAALGRIKQSLVMRDHLQAIEQSIINYWPTPPRSSGSTAIPKGGHHAGTVPRTHPRRRWCRPPRAATTKPRWRSEMAAASYPAGMTGAAKMLSRRPPRRRAPLPRLGLSFAYAWGAPEQVLGSEDEIRGDYFSLSHHLVRHPTYAAVPNKRFKTVARDLGLVDYWRARLAGPVWPAGASDLACD